MAPRPKRIVRDGEGWAEIAEPSSNPVSAIDNSKLIKLAPGDRLVGWATLLRWFHHKGRAAALQYMRDKEAQYEALAAEPGIQLYVKWGYERTLRIMRAHRARVEAMTDAEIALEIEDHHHVDP